MTLKGLLPPRGGCLCVRSPGHRGTPGAGVEPNNNQNNYYFEGLTMCVVVCRCSGLFWFVLLFCLGGRYGLRLATSDVPARVKCMPVGAALQRCKDVILLRGGCVEDVFWGFVSSVW